MDKLQQTFDKVVDAKIAALEKSREFVVKHERRQPLRVWIGMGALIGAILAGIVAGYLQRDFGKRNIEYFPDMAYSKAWEAQQLHHYPQWLNVAPLPARIAEWGTADMPPPDGTVYRGQRRLAFSGEDGMAQARQAYVDGEFVNPYSGLEGAELDAVLRRGNRMFIKNCQACHGVDGIGSAPVTRFGVGAPALNTAVVREKYNNAELFYIITHGINTMPAHASHVNYDDRWKVIMYLRKLQEGK
jgi:mono/diheme cytochrome c family protein